MAQHIGTNRTEESTTIAELMTLPFDVDTTGCHVPPSQRSDISSKQLKYYQDDYLVFHHYTSFTQMLSLSYICH